MTTAFVEPYAEIFENSDSQTGNFANPYRRLPEGVHTLMVVWGGAQLLRIYRAASGTASARVEIGVIPAGVGRRTLTIPGVGVKAGETAWLAMGTTSNEVDGQRATVQVVTTPLNTAGGGSLRSILGAARNLVAGWAK